MKEVFRLETEEITCSLCGVELYGGPYITETFALPCYEGKVDPNSEVYFQVCRCCYFEYNEGIREGQAGN